MRFSISTRLILSFLVIIVIMTGLFLVLSNRVISNRFTDLITRSGQSYAIRVAPFFERYYLLTGSWDGIEDVAAKAMELQENPQRIIDRLPDDSPLPDFLFTARDERLILFGTDDEIILDINQMKNPSPISPEIKKYGIPIMVDGEQVGTIVAGSAIGFLTTNQQKFLSEVNRILIWAALIAVVAVLIVAGVQSESIIRPIQTLSLATRKIALGQYDHRVDIKRNDELGDMARSFNEMALELDKQRQLRYRSMADIAHELRTPLSVLQIDLESMEDGLMEVSPENIRVLQTEVTHLRKLVEDLRILAQVDAGDLTIEKSVMEMGAIIREVIERQMSSARDKGVKLNFDSAEEEIFIDGDPQRISQVLINLISNAIRHTPFEGMVTVSMKRQDREVFVSVEDTGEGIPTGDLPFIFDRLYRVEKSRTRDLGGSGLGLSIAKSLVLAHDGKIWAESKEGQGSVFTFKLPLKV